MTPETIEYLFILLAFISAVSHFYVKRGYRVLTGAGIIVGIIGFVFIV